MSGVGGPPQHLAVDCDDAGARLAETRHELLKTGAKLVGVELTKHAAEGVVARHPVLQLQKAAEELLLGFGEDRHVDRRLTARQDRAQCDHQDLRQIMAFGVGASRVFHIVKAIA